MADYLTEDAIFQCAACPTAVIRATEPGAKTLLNGSAVLSEKATLYLLTPGVCPFLTKANGTPTPCAFPGLKGSDLTGADSKRTSAHSALLTKDVRGRCPHAGTPVISVALPSGRPGHFKQFAGTRFAGGRADNGSASDASPAGIGHPAPQEAEGTREDHASSQTPEAETSEKFTSCASGEKPVLRCDTCEEADSCEFLEKMRAKEVSQKSSTLLRNNYDARMAGREKSEKICSPILNSRHLAHKAYTHARATEEDFKKTYPDAHAVWNYPAHHIICGKLFDHPGLNALARAFDYDMNCADNCIMLLGKENKGAKLSGMELEEKHSYAFERMSWGRMQWHSGGHQYDLDKIQANIARQMRLRKYARKEDLLGEDTDYAALGIKCYLEHLKEKIAAIVQKYQRYKGCPKKNFPAQKERFHAAMNGLAHEIRKELSAFYQKPHHSHPWFVSKEAWIYAFMLPHCMHLVSMLPRGDGLLLERFNVTRYEDVVKSKGWLLSITPLKNANGAESLLWRNADGYAASGRFCADAAFFALGETMKNDCAGFRIPEEYIFRLSETGAESALAELQQKQSRLLGCAYTTLEETGKPLTPLRLMARTGCGESGS